MIYLGGQWNCDCAQHKGDNELTSQDVCYACPTPAECTYGICQLCYKRLAMGATARDPEDEEGGIVLHRGGFDDDEDPIFD